MSAQINIVGELEDFIVVSKPHNINFHDEEDLGNGFFNQVKLQLNTDQLYPVHRLDKLTSGLLIFAKNLGAAQLFQTLFQQHNIEKYYLAISDKKPTKKQGLIKGDMVKSRRGSWKLVRTTNNPAITQFFSYSIGNGQRLYLLKPHSGKTHQIRVSLASIGAPILGDMRYYPQKDKPQTTDRGYLHAFALSFQWKGVSMYFIDIPTAGECFLQPHAIEQIVDLNEPWQLNWPKL